MRTAILIYGEYRTMNVVSHSWRFDKCFNQYDVFISTWDYSKVYDVDIKGQQTFKTDIGGGFVVTEDMVRKNVPNATIRISKYNDNSSFINMKYHYDTGLHMINSSGEQYDSIMIMRCDLEFRSIFDGNDLIDTIEPKTIYGDGDITLRSVEPIKYFVNDMLFLGEYMIINEIFGSINCIGDTHITHANHILSYKHIVRDIRKFPQFNWIELVRNNNVH